MTRPRARVLAFSSLALVACASVAGPASTAEPGAAAPSIDASPPALAASATPAAPPATGAPPPESALAGEGFVKIAEEHGVTVYRREKRPGIELAAVGNIAGSPERVRRVLLDYPNHKRWQKHLKELRILGRGDGYLDVYERLTLPVLDDRDFSLHVTWGDDGSIPWVRFTTAGVRGAPAPVSGVVRVTAHEGGWRLEPLDGGKATHAVYRFHLDLAGSFPAWMAKGGAADDIPEFFTDLGKELKNYP